uniref:PX domain-containing protein n=1 Tax=Peronospora matthiolae TaxID=2874970 RepID=A0AAV1TDD4_9STRA
MSWTTNTTAPQVQTTPSSSAIDAATSSSFTMAAKTRNCSSSLVPLQRLECVRVSRNIRRNGSRFYVADVFLQRSAARCRLSESVYRASPASQLSPLAMRDFIMAEREPDFVVERRFSEFRWLRDGVVALIRANGGHVSMCVDCQELVQVAIASKHQYWTVRRLFGSKQQRFALLSAFVNDLLVLTTSAARGSLTSIVAESCIVREGVAVMLHEFLKRSFQPSLGII